MRSESENSELVTASVKSRHDLQYILTVKGQYYLQTSNVQLMFMYELPRMPYNATWNSVNCTMVKHETANKIYGCDTERYRP